MITSTLDAKSKFFDLVPDSVYTKRDEVEERLLMEYGAIFAAGNGAVCPPSIIFKDADAVDAFQRQIPKQSTEIGGNTLTLQWPAMEALIDARIAAEESGLTITPRGSDSAARSYDDTVKLWASRVEPALDHWCAAGLLSLREAAAIRARSPVEQVPEIFRLEAGGLYFSKDLSKSIIYSVAPPGSSQHLTLIAIDINEFNDPEVRSIMASNGWFQTVTSDLPHFTYLGRSEDELQKLGLKKVRMNEREFWVPDI